MVLHNRAGSCKVNSNLLELFCFLIKTFKTTTRFQAPLKMQSAVGDRREVFCPAFKLIYNLSVDDCLTDKQQEYS